MKPSFRENLRHFMKAAGVNQAELAHRVGVDPGVVSRTWLKGGKLPNTQQFLAILLVLKIADPWLLIGSSFKEPNGPRDVARPGRRHKDEALEPFLDAVKPRKPRASAPAPRTEPTTRRASRERE